MENIAFLPGVGIAPSNMTDDEKKLTTFSIHNCPRDLVGRVKAKAALLGQDKEKWVIMMRRFLLGEQKTKSITTL